MVFTRYTTLRERVEKEIQKHNKWCLDNCTNFSPTKYRIARLELGLSYLQVITDKIRCHN